MIRRESREAQVVEMSVMGYSHEEISKVLGISITHICEHMGRAKARVIAEMNLPRQELITTQLQTLRTVRYHAYQQYIQSLKPLKKITKSYRRKQVEEESTVWQDTADEDANVKMVLDSLVKYTEGRLGSNQYLATILATVKEECLLLGLYAPKDLNVNTDAVVQMDWSKLLASPTQVVDRVQLALDEVAKLPDAQPLTIETKPTFHNGTNGTGKNGKH